MNLINNNNNHLHLVIIMIIFSSLIIPFSVHALSMMLPGVGGNYNIKIKSFKERKFNTVYQQKFDYSCGSAAVASLLTFHYDIPITEQIAFNRMYENGNQALIQKQGFSLLDMKKYVQNKGLKAEGYRTTLDKLSKIGVPAITLINNHGYKHFVIIKGITDEDVLIGDPSVGTKSMPRKEFESIWNTGILFIINSRISIARSHFNEEWNLKASSPKNIALSLDPVADFNLMLPPPYDF